MSNFDPEWWRKIFDELYLATDARSIANTEITRVEVDLIEELTEAEADDFILDLCGGQGRHALELARRGYRNVVVVDYSFPLLAYGVREAGGAKLNILFLRCDARCLCLKESSIDHVVIMGNSFGYFRNDEDNCLIISEVARVLKPGGKIVVDLVNRKYIVSQFRPQSWHEADDDLIVCRDRKLESDGIVVREVVLSRQKGLIRDITYFSRLFKKVELLNIFRDAGFREVSFIDEFTPHKTRGDYGMLTNRTIVSAVAG